MLELVNFFEFTVVEVAVLGVVSSHRVSRFQQIVTKVTIAGFNHVGSFAFEPT